MHMRLEVLESCRLGQNMETLRFGDAIRADIEQAARCRRRLEQSETGPVLGLFTLGIKVYREFGVIVDSFPDCMQMQLPPDLRTGQKQLARVGAVHIVILS